MDNRFGQDAAGAVDVVVLADDELPDDPEELLDEESDEELEESDGEELEVVDESLLDDVFAELPDLLSALLSLR